MASLHQRLRSGMAVSYALLVRRSLRWPLSRSIPSIQARFFQPNVQPQGQAGLAQSPEVENSPVKDADQLIPPPLTSGLSGDASRAYPPPKYATRVSEPQHREEQMIDNSPQKQEAPLYYRGSLFDRVAYWQNIPRWKDVTEKQFLTYNWSVCQHWSSEEEMLKGL
jgi:hypothetical protein